jgi:ubiquinone biosynthesis protein COQ9
VAKESAASRVDRESQLAGATLKLLAKQQWRSLTLAAVARSAKLRLPDVLGILPSKAALPGLILRMLARETASRHRPDASSGSPRERLFDVTMSWFDVQQKDAPALKKLYRALQTDPATLFALRGDALHISGEFLALAEADFGASARVQAAIIAGVLVRAVSVWRDDDDEMGKTMAQLDRDLRRLERLLWPRPPKPAKPPLKKSRGRRKA